MISPYLRAAWMKLWMQRSSFGRAATVCAVMRAACVGAVLTVDPIGIVYACGK
jgi:hypothetical protein